LFLEPDGCVSELVARTLDIARLDPAEKPLRRIERLALQDQALAGEVRRGGVGYIVLRDGERAIEYAQDIGGGSQCGQQ
jgi:hypothetical protein